MMISFLKTQRLQENNDNQHLKRENEMKRVFFVMKNLILHQSLKSIFVSLTQLKFQRLI